MFTGLSGNHAICVEMKVDGKSQYAVVDAEDALIAAWAKSTVRCQAAQLAAPERTSQRVHARIEHGVDEARRDQCCWCFRKSGSRMHAGG
jgi:hypothetical protein